MSERIQGKSELARQMRDEFGPEIPTLTLARVLLSRHPAMFKNVDDARTALRYIEGKVGVRNSKKAVQSKYYMQNHRSRTPFAVPKPIGSGVDLSPYVLPSSFNDFILAGDFHVPNHRIPPIEAMLKYAKKNKIRQLFINGDLLDNTPFTRWQREPIKPSDVKKWFDKARDLLIEFKKHFDVIYWLEGNHDYWYERYLISKAPELFGDNYYKLENRLGLAEIGVTYIPQKYLVKAGHLNITHGHLLLRGGGGYANTARMLYMKTKANTICSHVHVESSHTEPDLNDKIVTTFSTGCMCTLRPEYQPYGGKACHGFAHIQVKRNRDFTVKNYRIFKGEIL